MAELMTIAEIHDFGVEIVYGYLQKEGHEIASVNTDLAMNPQIVARKDGLLQFIVVRTAVYPKKGTLDHQDRIKLVGHAIAAGARCYFASVGIANAAGTDDTELSQAEKGAGYHVAFDGIERLHVLQ